MDDITASIIVACQTDGAAAAVNKLGFSFSMLAKKALDFGTNAVSEFRTTQDAAWKFGKTFRDNMGSAEKAVSNFMDEYNLAESTARSMLTDTAQIMKGMGFDEKQSLEISETISRWGVDLASFTGYSEGAQGAVQAITASMMGENERLKGLGVVIREDSDEFKNLAKDIMTTKKVSEQHAKALAKLQLITIKAKDAKGDYAAEGENFTQSVNNLNEQIKQATSNIGEVIYESLRLNDAFGWIADSLKEISKKWKSEKDTWIYLIRDFTLNVATFFQIIWIPFGTLFEGIAAGFQNIANIGQWFNDNWSKMWKNLREIIKAVFLDIWEYIKWFWGPEGMITGFFVTAGKAIWEAIKTGMKGGDVGQVFKDAFSGYLDKNVIAGLAAQGKNVEAAMAKAGVSAMPKLASPDYDWGKKYANILDEANRQSQLELQRYKKRLEKKQNKRGESATAASFDPIISKDVAKAMFKYRATAQSAIDANSLEGQKLMSRRLTVGGEDWNKKTADGVSTIVGQLREIGKNVAQKVATPKQATIPVSSIAENAIPRPSAIKAANIGGTSGEPTAIWSEILNLLKSLYTKSESTNGVVSSISRQISSLSAGGLKLNVETRKY